MHVIWLHAGARTEGRDGTNQYIRRLPTYLLSWVGRVRLGAEAGRIIQTKAASLPFKYVPRLVIGIAL